MGGKLSGKFAELRGFLVSEAGGEAVQGFGPYFRDSRDLSLAELGKVDPAYALVSFVSLLFDKASVSHSVGKLGDGGGAHVQKLAEFAGADPVVLGDHHESSLKCGRKGGLHRSGAASHCSRETECGF
jgi:hypothetical protein